MMEHSDLIGLDPMEAVRTKFDRGRELYGDVWVGSHPVYCAHDEILDALAYILYEPSSRSIRVNEEVFDTLPSAIVKEVVRLLLEALHGVRMMVEVVGVGERDGSQDRSKEFGSERKDSPPEPEGCG